MGRRGLYSILLVMMTLITVGAIVRRGEISNINDIGYIYQYSDYMDYEDREYVGYIFDDYNKIVNIDYSDNVFKEDKDDSINIMSASLSEESTKEDIRSVRSEKIINERSVKDNNPVEHDAAVVYKNKGFDYDMKVDDKVDILNIMRKLDESEILQLKRIFDMETGKQDINRFTDKLKNKLLTEEYIRLKEIIYKYKE